MQKRMLADHFAGLEAIWNLKEMEIKRLRVERAGSMSMEEDEPGLLSERDEGSVPSSATKTPEKDALSSPEKNSIFRMPKISFLRKKPVSPPPEPRPASPTTSQSSQSSQESGSDSDSTESTSSAASSQIQVKKRKLMRPGSNERLGFE